MTTTERKQKLEKAEHLLCEVVDIMRELEENRPEKYGWKDLDEPLRRMQDNINHCRYMIDPTKDIKALSYIVGAQNALCEFEKKRDAFNREKIPED